MLFLKENDFKNQQMTKSMKKSPGWGEISEKLRPKLESNIVGCGSMDVYWGGLSIKKYVITSKISPASLITIYTCT